MNNYNKNIKIYILISLIFIVFIFFVLIYNIKKNIIESFDDLKPTIVNISIPTKDLDTPINSCKIPGVNPIGDLNDKKVSLQYAPQLNIHTSTCNKYWSKLPQEYNNELVKTEPYIVFSDQLKLPKERTFGNNSFAAGLFNFKKFATILDDYDYQNDNVLKKEIKNAKELLINPITKIKLNFYYELEYQYEFLNRTTWVNRWQKYNPSIKKNFEYDEIKSPIDTINILNIEFKTRLDERQKKNNVGK